MQMTIIERPDGKPERVPTARQLMLSGGSSPEGDKLVWIELRCEHGQTFAVAPMEAERALLLAAQLEGLARALLGRLPS